MPLLFRSIRILRSWSTRLKTILSKIKSVQRTDGTSIRLHFTVRTVMNNYLVPVPEVRTIQTAEHTSTHRRLYFVYTPWDLFTFGWNVTNRAREFYIRKYIHRRWTSSIEFIYIYIYPNKWLQNKCQFPVEQTRTWIGIRHLQIETTLNERNKQISR